MGKKPQRQHEQQVMRRIAPGTPRIIGAEKRPQMREIGLMRAEDVERAAFQRKPRRHPVIGEILVRPLQCQRAGLDGEHGDKDRADDRGEKGDGEQGRGGFSHAGQKPIGATLAKNLPCRG